MTKIKPIIMAGGAGTRLWPFSRLNYPKQFIKIFDNQSLFQKTLVRNKIFGKATVIIGEKHLFVAEKQIREINIEVDLIIEPEAKNTASCAILAALVAQNDGYENALLLPSDLFISDDEQYISIVNAAMNFTKHNIATIGIKPTSPNTGYGYIKIKNSLADKIYVTEKFIEKPELVLANAFINQRGYFWNSGIFMYNPSCFINQAKKFQSEMLINVEKSFNDSSKGLDLIRLKPEPYLQIESISVDHAIMERVENMIMLEANFAWNDLGSWGSLWEMSKKGEDNNHFTGDVFAKDVKNSCIISNNKLTAAVGLDNIIIINTDDTVLVANKDRSQEIKHIVNRLTNKKRKEATQHIQSFRPWGHYKIIDMEELYMVKKIVVHPKQKLSLQYHNHRCEHWIIVQGTAEIIIQEEISQLSKNDSIYIQSGTHHSLTNNGDIDLHLIQVQTGSYLQEDGIDDTI